VDILEEGQVSMNRIERAAGRPSTIFADARKWFAKVFGRANVAPTAPRRPQEPPKRPSPRYLSAAEKARQTGMSDEERQALVRDSLTVPPSVTLFGVDGGGKIAP
jgi:hypothetical protein